MDYKISFRPFRLSDAEFVNKLRQLEDMEHDIVGPKRPVAYERDVKWIEHIILGDHQSSYYFAITLKDNTEIIGYCSISEINYRNGSCYFSGIKIAPEHAGKGYGTDALLKSLVFVFEELRMVRCQTDILEHHSSSLKIFQKAGFQKEGLMRKAVFKNGVSNNVWLLSIINSEYDDIKIKYGL